MGSRHIFSGDLIEVGGAIRIKSPVLRRVAMRPTRAVAPAAPRESTVDPAT